ncbi:hypothetical protein HMPREF3159_03565 [Brachybacterium sp. HMSC06H03]|uniref:beta-sandwich lipoprotein n=1 Tax=Brachybacterium sp. HMSC06H03 TaxID=1581127 RepID=UPI0008A251ED|nr:hypothetical protein [Brachybacterium sp. HMSC06H03]OFT62603.1 hypothetical protein HMPREF3159_03565 [Brachybacterium sp. HMSC06H03]
MKLKKIIAATAALLAVGTLAACSAADRSSRNLSVAADNFEIERRITFINGITDTYLLTIEGFCSIKEDQGGDGSVSQLEVTCKVGDDQYEKHFLGLSDNVTYLSEQIETESVDPYKPRIIFRPETIIPDVDIETSVGDAG